MKYESRAIALNYIKHAESSIISKIFTEEKGLQSFIIKGVRTNKSKRKQGLFQPLELSFIDASYLPKKNLQYLNDIRSSSVKREKGINIKKNFIYLFIAEVLSKLLKENETDKQLFEFLWELKNRLSLAKSIDPNTPIQFLVDLTNYMGFYPLYKNDSYFNLQSGEFTNKKEGLKHYLNKENTNYFKYLIKQQITEIPYKNRNEILLNLIDYYKLQHHELKNMTSHEVIQSLR